MIFFSAELPVRRHTRRCRASASAWARARATVPAPACPRPAPLPPPRRCCAQHQKPTPASFFFPNSGTNPNFVSILS